MRNRRQERAVLDRTGARSLPHAKSRGSTVYLMDVNVERLDAIHRVAVHHAKELVIEVPAFVGRHGIQGLQVGKMPDSVMQQVLWPRCAARDVLILFYL